MGVLVYALGLGGQNIPTNGDELVYLHIARLTAASEHWLPLASELHAMRNTKPPLLFWQAMVASQWGQDWTLFALRLPSLVYTLLLTALIAFSVHGISQNLKAALTAACAYLCFFCTFRYGRPYLTSAAESFWLDLPMFYALWLSRAHLDVGALKPHSSQIRGKKVTYVPMGAQLFDIKSIAIWILIGISWGLGSAYKSFALIAPAAAAFWCAALLSRPGLDWRVFFKLSIGCSIASVLALAIFALWFVLDPDPGAVWREFVVGENAGKLNDAQGYWHEALYGGGSSLWAQLLAYVENAGLLAFAVLGLAMAGVSAWRRKLSDGQRLVIPAHLWVLLAWLAVWLVVFCIPSQRSARYVIPAMPALAMVLALQWERIGRAWFMATLALVGIALLAFARLAWVEHSLGIATLAQGWLAMGLALAGALAVLAGLSKAAWTRTATLLACMTFYACFNATLAPLDGPQGVFASNPAMPLRGKSIAVPNNFNAQFERFEFLLNRQHEANKFVPFDMAILSEGEAAQGKLGDLLKRFDAVVWASTRADETQAPCLQSERNFGPAFCQLLAQRWTIKGRHKSGEINWGNLWQPQDWLFSREWLLAALPPA